MRGADGEYHFNSIDLSKIKTNDLIHFGSATALLSSPLKDTYFQLLQYARESGQFISLIQITEMRSLQIPNNLFKIA